MHARAARQEQASTTTRDALITGLQRRAPWGGYTGHQQGTELANGKSIGEDFDHTSSLTFFQQQLATDPAAVYFARRVPKTQAPPTLTKPSSTPFQAAPISQQLRSLQRRSRDHRVRSIAFGGPVPLLPDTPTQLQTLTPNP